MNMRMNISLKMLLPLSIAMMMVVSMLLVAMPVPVKAANTTYYVDSVGGNDTNNGTSSATAWKSLGKVNNTTFQPGDKILFKAGGVWGGQLWPKGSGVSGSPIVIDKYGTGSNPIINGGGTTYPSNTSGAIMLYNQEYWEINNLEVTNYSTTVTSSRAGILVYNSQPGLKNHIYVRNCYVHDVNSDTNGNKITGGIIFFGTNIDKDGNATLGLQAGFNEILVENNHVSNVTKEGIRTKSDSGNGYPKISTNVVFRDNLVEEVWGDGMVISEVLSGGLAEYNTIKNHSKTTSGNYAGLWTHYTTGAVIQYNEVFGGSAGGNDGEGFDSDNNCIGDIFQYNYSHGNSGGFLLVMPSASNLKFRYNISENDGFRSGQEIFFYHSSSSGNEIYNNTVYIGSGITTQVFDNSSTNVKFYNNIIKSDGTVTKFANSAWSSTTEFKNNSFYPSTIDDTNGPSSHPGLVTSDPQLASPGTGGSNVDMYSSTKLAGYKLQSSSPLINAGVTVNANGGKDFWGNALYNGTPDIGAFEYGASAAANIVRINSGSASSYTDGSGRVYSEDTFFSGGASNSVTNEINNTTDDALFQTYRYGSAFNYNVSVPNGTYAVYLKFIEPYFNTSGSRVFDVAAEGVVKIDNLDVYNTSGKFSALEHSFTVTVSDGQLNLNFAASINNAIVSGITILKL
jgi:hypothetical protein